ISDYSARADGWRRSRAVGRTAAGDFDGDGRMDPAVYRAADGQWRIMLSGSGYTETIRYLGGPGYVSASGDYDGDGLADLAVYNESTGAWLGMLSGDGRQGALALGGTGWEPVPADYDGDGRTDPAVYHALTGGWRVLLSGSAYTMAATTLGGSGYLPAPADYDGDGFTDPAVYQLRTIGDGWDLGYWQAQMSGSGYVPDTWEFGEGRRYPVSGDYSGNYRSDPAVYRETDGRWFIAGGAGPLAPVVTLGGPGYVPVPGDYDGDGVLDIVVYHAMTGRWLAQLSGSGYTLHSAILGGPDYLPAVR
ncbi:MAG: VCBS repeat-containing protein, partial [Actinobacteria bacterium]|nr:VCBS repeat-containing protein [Actinomycetota bacterium]